MNRPLSVFVASPLAAQRIANLVGEVLGQSPRREDLDEGPVFRYELLDTEILLLPDHGLVDDGELHFSQYEFQLELRAFDRALALPGCEVLYENLALFFGAKLSSELRCPTMVVSNLQHKRASFPGSGDC